MMSISSTAMGGGRVVRRLTGSCAWPHCVQGHCGKKLIEKRATLECTGTVGYTTEQGRPSPADDTRTPFHINPCIAYISWRVVLCSSVGLSTQSLASYIYTPK